MVAAGAEVIHVDVMDGHFAPNLSMGPAVCAAIRRAVPLSFIDVHLMVERPSQFLEAFAQAGANHCTVHAEVDEPHASLAHTCHRLGMTAGIAVNPPTPVERIESMLEHFDLALVMSVNPGFSGQAFMPEVLDKVRWLRRKVGTRMRVEIDGGVSPTNAAQCVEAGVDVVVSASALFGSNDYAATIAGLRGGR